MDEDYPAITKISERYVLGLKDYTCIMCSKPIPAHTRHWVFVIKDEDGRVTSQRQHDYSGYCGIYSENHDAQKRSERTD